MVNRLSECLLHIENQFGLNRNEDGNPIMTRVFQNHVDNAWIKGEIAKLPFYSQLSTKWRRKAVIHGKNMVEYIMNNRNFNQNLVNFFDSSDDDDDLEQQQRLAESCFWQVASKI